MVRNVTGAPVVGDDLYGREDEIERLWEALARRESLLMLAPRRVGKTSLMRELQRDPRPTWDVVYINVEDARGAADLFARVIAALAQDSRYRNWLEAGRLPQALRSAWTSLTHVKALGVELKRAVGQDWASTADYLEKRLERLPEERRLLIIIDELPILVSRMLRSEGGHEDAALLLGRLRRWRQTPALRDKVQALIGGSIGLEGVLRRARLSASINDFVFDSPEREFAYEVLARASRLENGVPRSEIAAENGAREARTGEVLQALEADGYLERRDDCFAFRSNLVRVWWRKHRGAAP